ncbi:GTPase [Aquimarina sp. RZ0]|nr:GTPase [Aquimarina sp. RZ0]
MNRRILFVYNAKSDFLNKYLDVAHKIISPSTYSCDLCSLTHGNFSEKKIWKDFKEKTNHEFIFQYKNEFLQQYGKKNNEKKFKFPIILEQRKNGFNVLMSEEELGLLTSAENLIERLEKKLN